MKYIYTPVRLCFIGLIDASEKNCKCYCASFVSRLMRSSWGLTNKFESSKYGKNQIMNSSEIASHNVRVISYRMEKMLHHCCVEVSTCMIRQPEF